MDDFAGHAVLLASVWLVATIVASLLSAALYSPFRRAIGGSDPSTRSLATLAYALIAPAAGVATALVSLSPHATHLLIREHCHAGVCGSHAPLVAGTSLGGIGLVVAASLIALAAGAVAIRAIVYGGRRLRFLYALSRRSREREHLIVDSDHLFAWCCGLVRQQVVLSRALVERLSTAELDVVLAHERAHMARFDNLRNLAGRCATMLWPPGARARIRADLEADSERVCDLAAIRTCRSERLFRQVVEMMTPGRPHASPAKGATFGCDDATARVEALAEIDAGRTRLAAFTLLAFIWMLQLAAAIFLSHPVVEAIASLGG